MRPSETRLNEALPAAQLGVWEWTVETDTVTWDGNLYRIAGRDPELLAPSYQEQAKIFSPESWERLKAVVENALATGSPYELDLELVRPDGSKRWVIVRGEPLRDASGHITRVRGTVQDIAERRRAGEALKKSTQLLRDTGEMAKVGGWELDLSTQEVSWTEEVCRIHGVGPGYEPKLEEALSFYAPESRPALEEALKKTAETGEPFDFESLFIPSGSKDKIWVRLIGRAVYRGDKIVKLTGTFQDIDKYKRVEEALRESEAKQQHLFEHMSSGAAIYQAIDDGEDFVFKDFNRAAERIENVDRKAVIGRRVTEVFPGVRESGLFSVFQRVWKTGQPEYFPSAVYRDERDRGTWRENWVYKLPRGEVVAVYNDITERKRAEKALRESEARFEAIFESAAIGMALVDAHGHPVESNAALQKMLGYTKSELADMGFTEYTHPDDARADWDLFTELVEGKRDQYQIEKRFLRKDGQVVWGQLDVSLVRNETGEFKYCIGMVEDISGRKRTEEALRQLSGRLLRLQDEERRRMARELHETAAQSLAGLAVDLNMVKTLAPDLNPRASACLSESLELAEQCSREIRTISYLLHPPLVDEAGLEPALRWYTSGFAQRSGIEVHLDVSPEFGRLPNDHELTLYRIVQEGLTNIHHHSESKTARIGLERRPNEIVLTVADEGHGFPSAALGSAGPESSNIGVGIAGMRERLRQLGGRLHIQTGSRGTTLTANLPLGQVNNGQTTLSFGG